MTTDQMDGLFTETDIAEKYNAFAQCRDCQKWTYLHGDSAGIIKNNSTCEHCGGHSFDPQSVTSRRTFNIVRLKSRKAR